MNSISLNKNISYKEFVKYFDHTVIKPNLTEDKIIEECIKARDLNVACVVVQPAYIPLCAKLLSGSSVNPAVPIGFPHGGHTTMTKVFEAKNAIENGARELDMVINIIKLLSKMDDYVRDDIREVVALGHSAGVIVKAILCTGYLTQEEIIRGCILAEEACVDFVKSSTGFDPAGATPEIIRLMRKTVSPTVQIKAAQGIDSIEKSINLINAGATRLGTSSTFKIIENYKEQLKHK